MSNDEKSFLRNDESKKSVQLVVARAEKGEGGLVWQRLVVEFEFGISEPSERSYGPDEL